MRICLQFYRFLLARILTFSILSNFEIWKKTFPGDHGILGSHCYSMTKDLDIHCLLKCENRYSDEIVKLYYLLLF